MASNSDLEEIKQYFGIYYEGTSDFDRSVNALLGLGLPLGAVREIVSGIWNEAYDKGEEAGW